MQVFHTLGEAAPACRSAVALGYFDGLHIGHAAVIGGAVARSQAQGLCAAVFTFTMDGGRPVGKAAGSGIITDSEKNRLLADWRVSTVLSPDFSEFQEMSPTRFVDEVLVRRLSAAVACCGHDFRFGRDAAGDVGLLARLCDKRGIELDLIPAVNFAGARVSSTRIRALLAEGRVEEAEPLLGRTFGYDFAVVRGKQLGRTIDIPTINQPIPPRFVTPRHGVYASLAFADGAWRPSVTSIGLRPTVEESTVANSETHIMDFAGDLYGQNVEVRLLKFLRPELKFSSIAEMQGQIFHDVENALSCCAARTPLPATPATPASLQG